MPTDLPTILTAIKAAAEAYAFPNSETPLVFTVGPITPGALLPILGIASFGGAIERPKTNFDRHGDEVVLTYVIAVNLADVSDTYLKSLLAIEDLAELVRDNFQWGDDDVIGSFLTGWGIEISAVVETDLLLMESSLRFRVESDRAYS